MHPFFLNGSAGNLFGLYFPPVKDKTHQGDILFIPPFAEELNRSRHMISRQARAFSARGFGVLLIDLYGTGDSQGRFEDARWDIWKNDLLKAIDWLKEHTGHKPRLWAMRTGALLALDLLKAQPDLTERMLLWAPVAKGRNFINQFLRIQLAANMSDGSDTVTASTTQELFEQLNQGQSLEIGGYALTPEMAQSLSSLSLANLYPPSEIKINWLDISLTEQALLSPGSQRIIKHWKERGVNISAKAIKDVPFWSLQEPEWALSLIEESNILTTET